MSKTMGTAKKGAATDLLPFLSLAVKKYGHCDSSVIIQGSLHPNTPL